MARFTCKNFPDPIFFLISNSEINVDDDNDIICLTDFITLTDRLWGPVALLVFSSWIIPETSFRVVELILNVLEFFFSNKRSIFLLLCVFFPESLYQQMQSSCWSLQLYFACLWRFYHLSKANMELWILSFSLNK